MTIKKLTTYVVRALVLGALVFFAQPQHARADDLNNLLRGIFNGGGTFNGNGFSYNSRKENMHLDAFVYRFNPRGVAINELRDVLFQPEKNQNTDNSWRGNVDGDDVWGTIRVTETKRGPQGVCRSFQVEVNWILVEWYNGQANRQRQTRSVYGEACLAANNQGQQFWVIGDRYWQ